MLRCCLVTNILKQSFINYLFWFFPYSTVSIYRVCYISLKKVKPKIGSITHIKAKILFKKPSKILDLWVGNAWVLVYTTARESYGIYYFVV